MMWKRAKSFYETIVVIGLLLFVLLIRAVFVSTLYVWLYTNTYQVISALVKEILEGEEMYYWNVWLFIYSQTLLYVLDKSSVSFEAIIDSITLGIPYSWRERKRGKEPTTTTTQPPPPATQPLCHHTKLQ